MPADADIAFEAATPADRPIPLYDQDGIWVGVRDGRRLFNRVGKLIGVFGPSDDAAFDQDGHYVANQSLDRLYRFEFALFAPPDDLDLLDWGR